MPLPSILVTIFAAMSSSRIALVSHSLSTERKICASALDLILSAYGRAGRRQPALPARQKATCPLRRSANASTLFWLSEYTVLATGPFHMHTYMSIWYNTRRHPRKTSARTPRHHPSLQKRPGPRSADPVFPSHRDGGFNPSDRLSLGGLGVGRSSAAAARPYSALPISDHSGSSSGMEPASLPKNSLRQLTATMRPRTISRTAKTSCRPLVAATETAAVVAVAGMVPKKP